MPRLPPVMNAIFWVVVILYLTVQLLCIGLVSSLLYRSVRYAVRAMSRPKQFDETTALDAAMHVFWRQGYEGTSLADLTAAMGINRPSLYATFGNKEALFRRAVERYLDGPSAEVIGALELPTARETVVAMLAFFANAPAIPDRPRGCLMVNAALGCSDEAAGLRDELATGRQAAVIALRERIERAQRDGDVAADVDADALAFYVWTVIQGMSVQAKSGATPAQLRATADLAMRAWPADAPRKPARRR